MKLTKRKQFNFFRSYYDVYNEIPNDKDKLAFIDALFTRQFLGVKPEGLTGMAKFAYISQTNSIDSQVKGYEDKTKTKLNPLEDNNYTPTVGGQVTPIAQVEEKVINYYTKLIEEIKAGKYKTRTDSIYMQLRIKEGTLTPLIKDFKHHLITQDVNHKTTNDVFKHFVNWLNTQNNIGKLDQFKR